MENTLINREKLFAQYWGQKVLTFNDEYESTDAYLVDGSIDEDVKLLLTPLKLISDEDAIEVTEMCGVGQLSNTKKDLTRIGREIVLFPYLEGKSIRTVRQDIWLQVSDFLRSKGYALPYLGVSVEQQIDYGWIKLKTDE